MSDGEALGFAFFSAFMGLVLGVVITMSILPPLPKTTSDGKVIDFQDERYTLYAEKQFVEVRP